MGRQGLAATFPMKPDALCEVNERTPSFLYKEISINSLADAAEPG
jgi:hypothetical protein